MKRMQLTSDQERDKFAAQKKLYGPVDRRLALNTQSRLKLRRFQSVESISILKEGDTYEQNQDPMHVPTQIQTITTQWPGNEPSDSSSGEEQLHVARELVKKNRRIFELEQVGYHSNTHLFAPAPTAGGFTSSRDTCNRKLMALAL